MEDRYRAAALMLVRSISEALDHMDEHNYGLAADVLKAAWNKAAQGDAPDPAGQSLLLR